MVGSRFAVRGSRFRRRDLRSSAERQLQPRTANRGPRTVLACLLLLLLAIALHGSEMAETRLPGFRLRSTADAEATRQLGSELTRIREALASWLGGNVRPLPRDMPDLTVLYFASRSAFQDYAHAHARNVATAHAEGFYSGDGTPGGGQLVLFRDGGRELGTVRHELVHYLIDQILPARAGQPVWFNEGLAVSAEEAWIDPGQVRISAVPMQRQALLRQLAADGDSPLAGITALGADGWLERAGADRSAADRQYAASYGAVLFLLNRHPQVFWGFLKRLAAGEAHETAYATAFTSIPGGLDAAWRTWAARGAWQAARAVDGSASAAAAVELGMAWLPENLPPGDPTEAARWLSGAARGFAATPGYELDAASAWLSASRALGDVAPAKAAEDAEAAAELYAQRGHLAGQAEAMLQACRAWGDDAGKGDWTRAAALGRIAVQLAEAVGPDSLRASTYAAYGSCFVHGRATAAPDGGDPKAEAAHALARARELHHASGDLDQEASVVLLTAQALAPDDGTAGDWAACLALADEALALWRRLPDQKAVRADLARALAVRASLQRPDRNPQGDWAAAERGYVSEAELIAPDDDRRMLRNLIDRATCQLGRSDPEHAAVSFAQAERRAILLDDQALAAYAAYQIGWSLQKSDPSAAADAFLRAAPRYRAAGRSQQEALAVSQAAQSAATASSDPTAVAALFGRAAALEQARKDVPRLAYNLYQQAWYSEPSRQPGADPAAAGTLYLAAATAWKSIEPVRAAQALQQRARVLNPATGARAGWGEAVSAWRDVAAALAVLPDATQHQGDRGHALHQQAWCLIQGDAKRMTREARGLFTEAVRLQDAAGDAAGAKTSRSWIRE